MKGLYCSVLLGMHGANTQHDCRFDVALVSLFWLAAGMGLPASLPPQYADGTPDYGIVLYFVSFVLVLNWTLLQVYYVAITFIQKDLLFQDICLMTSNDMGSNAYLNFSFQ